MKISICCVGMVAMGLIGCEKDRSANAKSEQEYQRKLEVTRIDGSQSGKGDARATSPSVKILRDRDIASQIPNLVASQGIGAIDEITGSLEGADRDVAMTAALSLLAKEHRKGELLEKIAALPPGESKQKWLWKVVEKGQGEFDASFYEVAKKLSYPEELKTVSLAFASSMNVRTVADLEAGKAFLGSMSEDKQYVDSLSQKLVASYVSGLSQLPPEKAAASIRELPGNYQVSATEATARKLADPANASGFFQFASTLGGTPGLADLAYRNAFERFGYQSPSSSSSLINQVPEQYQSEAIHGYVSGWVRQDPIAVSEWARSQSVKRMEPAAKAIVSYLRNKKADPSEIEAWEKMAGN